MSDTTTTNSGPNEILTDDDFDKIFEAEQSGSNKDRREAYKEVDARITNTPPPVVTTPDPEDNPDPLLPPDQQHQQEANPPGTPPAQEAPKDANSDWLASLDPAIKANVEKLLAEKTAAEQAKEQYIRSNEGRIAAEQRKAQQLEQKLREATQKAAVAPPKQPATPSAPETANERRERLRALKEADELTGGLLEELMLENERLKEETLGFKQTYENDKKDFELRRLETEVRKVREHVPNFDVIEKDPAFQWYMNNAAPKAVYEAFYENPSPNADDTLFAINQYGAWAEAHNARLAAQQNQGAGTPAATQQPVASAQAQKTQAERDRKVNAGPVTNGVTRPSAVPTDPLEGIANDPKKSDRFHDELFEKELKRLTGG